MAIVWVIQEGNNDYSAAEDFGEVRFVTHSDLVKYAGSRMNMQVTADVREFVHMYIPTQDYITPAGNPALVAMVMATVGYKYGPHVRHNILKWDGRRAAYVPFQISIVH